LLVNGSVQVKLYLFLLEETPIVVLCQVLPLRGLSIGKTLKDLLNIHLHRYRIDPSRTPV
jgi:hypothetical protein